MSTRGKNSQGSVINLLSFIVTINYISSVMRCSRRWQRSNWYTGIQCVSDVNFYKQCIHLKLESKLQYSINKLITWSTNKGLRFSMSKAKMLNFMRKNENFLNPLQLFNKEKGLPFNNRFSSYEIKLPNTSTESYFTSNTQKDRLQIKAKFQHK